jgi:proteasome accessory factor B
MLHIHSAIQSGKYPNANTLARELEVSPRSVGRDVEFMRGRLGLPIVYDEARHGFYYDGEVGAFPSLTISEGELFALVVAEKALQQYRGTSFEKPLVSAFRKMAESLPDTISLNLSEWDSSISFRTSAEPIVNLEVFDELARATARRLQLRIFYRKPGQKTAAERVIDPYHLANVNGEWFLFAFDHMRKAIRTFVPARIQRIEKTGVKFERPAGFSIQQELRNSFGVHSGRERIRVVLRFNDLVADYIREKKWHPSQKLRNLPGGAVELQMVLSSTVEVERWVLSWGGNAEVIAPPELAQSVRAAAERILHGPEASAVAGEMFNSAPPERARAGASPPLKSSVVRNGCRKPLPSAGGKSLGTEVTSTPRNSAPPSRTDSTVNTRVSMTPPIPAKRAFLPRRAVSASPISSMIASVSMSAASFPVSSMTVIAH